MRGRTFIFAAILSAAIPPSGVADAQLSPQGILGGITRPFRQALGHFGHSPRIHRHRRASEPRAASPAPPSESSAISGSRLGFAGVPAWPTAYEDVLGFAFWPDDYASRLRGRGFDVIADTIAGRFDLPRTSARTATIGAAALWRSPRAGTSSRPGGSSRRGRARRSRRIRACARPTSGSIARAPTSPADAHRPDGRPLAPRRHCRFAPCTLDS